ncbi:MAG: S8 family serine peptidase [Actinobacteria bacterium]|nr:S8 family serine peptidase [Actinomycetota bacterium]
MTGEAGGTTGRRRVAALVGVLALVLAACGGGGDEPAATEATEATTPTTGPEPELATATTTWDDGYDHVVVLTENAVTGGTGDEVQEPVLDEPSSADEAERIDAEAPADESATTEPPASTDHDSTDHDPTDHDPTDHASAPHTTSMPEVADPSAPIAPRTGNTLPVSTVAPGAAPAPTTTAPAAASPSEVASLAPVPGATPREGDVLEVVVVRADGTSERATVPFGSLKTTLVRTQAESDLLAKFADQPLAVLVRDVDGVAGAPGRRYVMIPGQLIEVAGQGDATTTTVPAEGATEPAEPAPAEPVDETTTTEPEGDEPEGDESETAGPPTAPPTDEEILAVIIELPGVVSAEIVAPGVIAVATSGDREDLRRVPGVVSVEDDTLFDLADDPDQGKQWMLKNTGSSAQAGGWSGTPGADANVEAAWTVTQGTGVVVAVIDSGVDIDHPDLAANIWVNPRETCGNGADDDRNGFVDDCRGWDFGANDSDPRPQSGTASGPHGTHVAGIIGAAHNGTGVVGVAPQAKLMALKVATPDGQLSTSAIYSAIVYAADNGAKVINLSLGTSPGTPRNGVTTMEQAIAYAGTRGVTVIAASGNNGVDISNQAVYPANFSLSYPHVVTVGASTNSDARASFSNFGTPLTLVAPGFFMWSTIPGSWGWMSGTSMATPAVAGAVADLLATGQVTTPTEVRARLVQRADTTSAGPRLDVGSLVGVGLPPTVSVSYGGADQLVADRTGRLVVDVRAQNLPPDVSRARVSLAANVQGQVYAIAGLPASFTTTGGTPTSLVTDDNGAFSALSIGDTASLASTGWSVAADLELPAGEYAIVTELLDGSGAAVGGASVAYVSITGAPASGGGAVTTTVVGANPITTSPATTTPASGGGGGGGGGGGATPTTTPAPGTTTPTGGGGGGGGGGTGGTNSTLPQAATTLPVGGGSGGGGGSPTVTTQPMNQTTVPTGVTSPPAPGTTVPQAPSTPTTAPGSPATTAPISPTTPTTTPAPAPDSSGQWRVDSMDPRVGPVAGGTTIVLSGRFPTTVPIYVWFGDAIVEAWSNGSSISVVSPAVASPGVVDVSVKFRTTTNHTLTLTAAYTYAASTPGGGGGSGGGSTATTTPATTPVTNPASPPVTTAPSNPGSGGGTGGGTATTAPAAPITTPTTTPAATPTTTPAAPTPTAPSATTAPAPGTPPTLGNLRLTSRPTSGALSRLSPSAWPASGCRSATCPASGL